MTNTEERLNRFRKGLCPDCLIKLKKIAFDDGKPPLSYCEGCNNSFEILGDQVMSEGDAIKRSNDKWQLYRDTAGDGYGMGLKTLYTHFLDQYVMVETLNPLILKGKETFRWSSKETETERKEQTKMTEDQKWVVGNWYKRIKNDWEDFKVGEVYQLAKINSLGRGGVLKNKEGIIVNRIGSNSSIGYRTASFRKFVPVDPPNTKKDICNTELDMEKLRRTVIPYDCYGYKAHRESLQQKETNPNNNTVKQVKDLMRSLCGPERTDVRLQEPNNKQRN